jgi:Zinc finger, C3HC4 type (RING finger)/RNA recognition motif. (a.k.a. RRM, RBD, or RNP domain)
MGYAVTRFTLDLKFIFHLLCSVCHLVAEDPVQWPKCEHLFCKNCFNNWIQTKKICPIDNSPLDETAGCSFVNVPKSVGLYLSCLQILCEFVGFGCKEHVIVEFSKAHSIVCSFNPKNALVTDPDIDAKRMRLASQLLDKSNHTRHHLSLLKEKSSALRRARQEFVCEKNASLILKNENDILKIENENLKREINCSYKENKFLACLKTSLEQQLVETRGKLQVAMNQLSFDDKRKEKGRNSTMIGKGMNHLEEICPLHSETGDDINHMDHILEEFKLECIAVDSCWSRKQNSIRVPLNLGNIAPAPAEEPEEPRASVSSTPLQLSTTLVVRSPPPTSPVSPESPTSSASRGIVVPRVFINEGYIMQVTNIPAYCKQKKIKSLFKKFGNIKRIIFSLEQNVAFVLFRGTEIVMDSLENVESVKFHQRFLNIKWVKID